MARASADIALGLAEHPLFNGARTGGCMAGLTADRRVYETHGFLP